MNTMKQKALRLPALALAAALALPALAAAAPQEQAQPVRA
ncbi:MAG: EF-hand domain-containing protein, partial [Acidobacteria bacterium]|nr:EF-hand domain-containing protein [Acidobacteriota bacterium]